MNRALPIALAITVAIQGVWLAMWAPEPARLQWLLVTGAAALAVYQAWITRRRLPAHIDMLLLMGGFGGMGMMIGGWFDLGFPMNSASVSHGAHHNMGLLSWMTALMLLFAVPPAIAFSRCLENARRSLVVLPAVAIDVAGMLLGMFAAHHLWAMPLGHALGSHFAGMHLAMLGGMLAGMVPAMFLRDWMLGWIEARRPARSPGTPTG